MVFSDPYIDDKLQIIYLLDEISASHCENCADMRQHLVDFYAAHFIKYRTFNLNLDMFPQDSRKNGRRTEPSIMDELMDKHDIPAGDFFAN